MTREADFLENFGQYSLNVSGFRIEERKKYLKIIYFDDDVCFNDTFINFIRAKLLNEHLYETISLVKKYVNGR